MEMGPFLSGGQRYFVKFTGGRIVGCIYVMSSDDVPSVSGDEYVAVVGCIYAIIFDDVSHVGVTINSDVFM